jgi:hypothetical protein
LPDPHVLEDAKHTMALKAQNYDPIYPDPIWSLMGFVQNGRPGIIQNP